MQYMKGCVQMLSFKNIRVNTTSGSLLLANALKPLSEQLHTRTQPNAHTASHTKNI